MRGQHQGDRRFPGAGLGGECVHIAALQHHAVLERLKKAGLVRSERERLEVTDKGKKALQENADFSNAGPNEDEVND
jgi:hypothetical protein